MMPAPRHRRRARRPIGIAAGTLLALAGLASAPAPAPSVPEGATRSPAGDEDRRIEIRPDELLYPDELRDPIRASILSLHSDSFAPEDVLPFLQAACAAAPQREVVVLTDPEMSEHLEPLVEEHGVVLLDDHGRLFSPWPRDPFSVVGRRDGGLVLVDRPFRQPAREADAHMARELARRLPESLGRAWGGIHWGRAPVPFHNGHVLMAGGAAWISLHSLEPRILEILGLDQVPAYTFGTAEGIDRYLEVAERARADLAELYGKPVRLVHPVPESGATPERTAQMQQIGGGGGFDLDSVLTLLPARGDGNEDDLRALVGDPAAGRRLLADLAPEGWAALASTYDLEIPHGRPSGPLLAYQTSGRAEGLEGFLDLVAEHLRAAGMTVDRLPLVLVPVRLLEDGERFEHEDFVIGWNNAVLEPRDDRVRAEAFASGIPEGDRRARTAYEAAGVDLVLLPPLVPSVVRNGGYRCASNQVRVPCPRGASESSPDGSAQTPGRGIR